MGSWKTMAMRSPRIWRIRASGQRPRSSPWKADFAGHQSRGGLEQPQDGHGGDGLAAARLPHQAQGLAGGQVKTHPGHGPGMAPGPGEIDREILYLQQRGGGLDAPAIFCQLLHKVTLMVAKIVARRISWCESGLR